MGVVAHPMPSDIVLDQILYNNPMQYAQIDTQRQRKAKVYSKIRRRLMLVDLGISATYVLAWLLLGWSVGLRDFLLGFTSSQGLLVLGFAFVFGGIFYLINLPLSYFSGFVLPHRFGQSNQSLRAWVVDQVKGLLVSGVLGAGLLLVIYAVLRAYPLTWWLWAAGILMFFSVILANLAPVLLYPIFYKFVPLGDEHQELADRLIRLSERAGTRVQGVFKFDMSRRTQSANAALTGLGNTRRILLSDTMIQDFTVDEIETVLAHELGHHVHRDIPVGIVFDSLVTLAGLWLASQVLAWGTGFFGFQGIADVAALPLLILVFSFYGLVTSPILNAYSRWRERRADRYALDATDNGPAFASALARLANQNLADADPEPWVEFLLHSHPALGKRIAAAEAYRSPR
jgi:STE24 endopeptidase